MITEIIITVIVVLSIFLVGYEVGKMQGTKYGVKLGETSLPLALRQKSFEIGCCILCGRNVEVEDDLYDYQIEKFKL